MRQFGLNWCGLGQGKVGGCCQRVMNLWVLQDAGNNLTSWLAELLSNDSAQSSCGIRTLIHVK